MVARIQCVALPSGCACWIERRKLLAAHATHHSPFLCVALLPSIYRSSCVIAPRDLSPQKRHPQVSLLGRRSEWIGLVEFAFALAAGIVDVDGFGLGIKVKHFGTLFPRANPSIFQATKRHLRLAAEGR